MNCSLIFKVTFSFTFIASTFFASDEGASAAGKTVYGSIDISGVDFLSKEYDSLRMETRGGKQVVVHQVDRSETLYSISRRYQVTVEEVMKANRGLGTSIAVGQEIFIPYEKRNNVQLVSRAGTSSDTYHLVELGQTLYAISRMYDVRVEDIKAWNNLATNELSAGQKLVIKKPVASAVVLATTNEEAANEPGSASYPYYIVQPSETLFSISRKFDVSVDEIKEWSKLSGNALSVGQKILVGNPDSTEPATAALEEAPPREKKKELVVRDNGSLKQINKKGYTTDTTQVAGYQKVLEEGFAQVIENSPDTNKFLALHRTAPIGAILEVKNRMNSRSIYVRVVGTLPDTGINNKVLIRLSQKAFERLGSLDPRVPVEVSYVP